MLCEEDDGGEAPLLRTISIHDLLPLLRTISIHIMRVEAPQVVASSMRDLTVFSVMLKRHVAVSVVVLPCV